MDLLTAFSLAGTIVQFVDFGSKLLSRSHEIYQSTGGRLAVDEELELITADLSALVNKIRNARVQDSNKAPIHASKSQQAIFEKICDEATQIAQTILLKLAKLKIDDSKNRKLESFRIVWKRIWSQSEIDDLLGRLSRLKDVINAEALTSILQNTNELNVRTLARFDSLDQQTQLILTSLLQSNQDRTREILTSVAQLMSRLETFNLEEHRRTREMIIERHATDPTLQAIEDITPSVEILAVSQQEESFLRASVQRVKNVGGPIWRHG